MSQYKQLVAIKENTSSIVTGTLLLADIDATLTNSDATHTLIEGHQGTHTTHLGNISSSNDAIVLDLALNEANTANLDAKATTRNTSLVGINSDTGDIGNNTFNNTTQLVASNVSLSAINIDTAASAVSTASIDSKATTNNTALSDILTQDTATASNTLSNNVELTALNVTQTQANVYLASIDSTTGTPVHGSGFELRKGLIPGARAVQVTGYHDGVVATAVPFQSGLGANYIRPETISAQPWEIVSSGEDGGGTSTGALTVDVTFANLAGGSHVVRTVTLAAGTVALTGTDWIPLFMEVVTTGSLLVNENDIYLHTAFTPAAGMLSIRAGMNRSDASHYAPNLAESLYLEKLLVSHDLTSSQSLEIMLYHFDASRQLTYEVERLVISQGIGSIDLRSHAPVISPDIFFAEVIRTSGAATIACSFSLNMTVST
jgi:hypothetical protein